MIKKRICFALRTIWNLKWPCVKWISSCKNLRFLAYSLCWKFNEKSFVVVKPVSWKDVFISFPLNEEYTSTINNAISNSQAVKICNTILSVNISWGLFTCTKSPYLFNQDVKKKKKKKQIKFKKKKIFTWYISVY